MTTGLGAHGEEALRLEPPQPGQRVLDIGCGFGDTTQRIAGLVGASGEALGVDAAARAQTIVEQIVSRPEEHDDPPCGPGPFSMSGADTTSDILLHAGYADIALREGLAEYAGDDGVRAPASTWIVTASA